MELWTVGNKTVMLLFVIALSYFETAGSSNWLVLFFLIYVSLNLQLHLVKRERLKQAFITAILLYTAACAVYAHPAFVLLLPLSAYELASFYIRKRIFPFVAILAPMFILHGTLLVIYGFAAVYSCLNYLFIRHYMDRVNRQEDKLERMRAEHQELTKKLNDNREFIRTSEYMVKLEERNRLSQEIHDGIGHSMTGALIQMEAAKRLLKSDPAAAGTLLQNAIGISKAGIEEIRLTLKNTKPPVEQLGWSRLRSAVDSFGAKSGLMTTAVQDGNMESITPLQWKIIHENVTEALTNAAKYSEATAVHVEVRVLNRLIKAVVSDNGRGAAKVVKGLGLIGMEERTAAVNGTVVADGTKGFTVTTLIPYGGKEEPHESGLP